MTGFHHASVTLDRAYRVFFEALKLDDIDALVSAAWNFFNLPVLLTDENYKLIAQYPRQTIGEPVWDALFAHKVLPTQVIVDYQQAYLQDREKHYNPFYADSGLVAQCPRIFAEVYEGEQIFGHLAVFMFSEPLLENDIPAVSVLLDALKMLMVPRKNRTHMSLSTYLKDLLAPDTAPQVRALAERGLSAGLQGAFSVMATPVGDTASQRAFASVMVSQISANYRSAISTVYNGVIVTLFGMMKGTDGRYTAKEYAFFDQVIQRLAPANAHSGISQSFSSLSQLRGRFMQALTTAKATQRPYDFFDQLYPAPLFWLIGEQPDVELFLHPLLAQLQESDRQNHTEYFQTLLVYCTTFRDKDLTAQTLCIHRNTLLYRLNRIYDLFGFDFEAPQELCKLLNSFQLWEILQQRNCATS